MFCMPNPLWMRTLLILLSLRPAFSRTKTHIWFSCAVCALLIRTQIDGVASMASAMGGGRKVYSRLLAFFASCGVDHGVLASYWGRILFRHPLALKIRERHVLVLDGTKAPRSGKRMPGVKRLHQSATTNTKPEYITGHSLQSVAVLFRSLNGATAVPLFSRIVEGLRRDPGDKLSQLERFPPMLKSVMQGSSFYLVADAYYYAGKFANAILAMNGHLITRARGNAVAYLPAEPSTRKKRARGRPKKYGEKKTLQSLAKIKSGYLDAPSPVYGESGVTLFYKVVTLMWRPAERLVKFIIVRHPNRGKGPIYLMTTDLEMEPLQVIMAYGLRFKIEVSFKAAVHTMGSFAYRFWTKSYPSNRKIKGDQYTHKMDKLDSEKVWRKFNCYHLFLQTASIAQGIAQILAAEMPSKILELDTDFKRTVIPLPSEATVKRALAKTCFIFSGMPDCAERCVNRMALALLGVMPIKSGEPKEKAARMA